MNSNKAIQLYLMKNIDYKTSAHNVQHQNNKKWQYFVELLEEDSLMTRNN